MTPVELSDREVLEALYHATDGPNWKRSDNWLTDAPLREWHGIGSEWHDGDERVERMLLGNNGLSVCAPSRDRSTGPADAPAASGPGDQPWAFRPDPGEHRQATAVGIAKPHRKTPFPGSIPASIRALNRLRHLHLQGNDLSGPIPPGIGNLAALETLLLDANNLTGPIPPEIGNLAALRELQLSQNQLTGPIPNELGNMWELVSLSLPFNELEGEIPASLGEPS